MNYVVLKLTEDNFRNNSISLERVMDFFPRAAIGGNCAYDKGGMLLEIHTGTGQPVFTDIAGDKKIFRKRAWVREFFDVHRLKPGSRIVIERTSYNHYHIYPSRG